MTESEGRGVARPAVGGGYPQLGQTVEQSFQQLGQTTEQSFQQIGQTVDLQGFPSVAQPIGWRPGSQSAAASPDEPANEIATERDRGGQ